MIFSPIAAPIKKILRGVFFGLIATALNPPSAHAWPWSKDMTNQPSIKPQEGVMTPFPRRSVPITGVATPYPDRDATEKLVDPVPADAKSIATGRTLFKIYCAACHGLTGRAESPVSDLIGAPDLTDPRIQKDITPGWIFGTITFGGAIMPAYGVPQNDRGSNDLNVHERWDVVNYVRHRLVRDAQKAGQVSARAQNAGD
ncbi:c-type cytochrome [Varunaivibrio sulfuroxidans]|uniref:Mono/diheme cytochrome c family protein n=1 Tax=Varunaivibrio sulfuroxidans TaxID=1773489 RepID=A0A4R3J6D5_9PROT|nr:cytochrome c [Varunaivibrio sulfuroxidans]TCS60922.1 mono/diheme cytochrome c family protein [Varunaivibrio sulfuroxidans]WES31670.1 cytochrome c [Varunaivibrio sulfuroxidans]